MRRNACVPSPAERTFAGSCAGPAITCSFQPQTRAAAASPLASSAMASSLAWISSICASPRAKAGTTPSLGAAATVVTGMLNAWLACSATRGQTPHSTSPPTAATCTPASEAGLGSAASAELPARPRAARPCSHSRRASGVCSRSLMRIRTGSPGSHTSCAPAWASHPPVDTTCRSSWPRRSPAWCPDAAGSAHAD